MGDVIPVAGPCVHLAPPAGLTADEAQVWRETVEARSADYFGEDAAPLLEEYARVVVMCRLLAVQIQTAIAGGGEGDGEGTVRLLKELLDMRDKESRRMTSIATKLRITNQSRYTPDKASVKARKGAGGKVWQFGQKTGG